MIDRWSIRDALREAGDEHFYGPWKGGPKSSGGGPMSPAEQAAARDAKTRAGKTVGPEQAVADLAAGKRPHVTPDDVAPTMDILAQRTGTPLDLTELQVEGTLKFGGDGMGLPRSEMPQLPGDKLQTYMADLKGRGITVTTERVAPASMKPIQKEVNATKSAQMAVAMREGTLKKGPIVITKDDYVLDGHHRWAAGTAQSFIDPSVRIDAVRIGMNADKLLTDALKWTHSQGIARRGIHESATWDGVREAGEDHFYGPWKGGAKGAGGRPAEAGGTGTNPLEVRDRWSNADEMVAAMEAKYPGSDWSALKGIPFTTASDSADAIDTLNSRFGTPPNFQGVRVVPHGPPGVLAEVKRVDKAVPGSAVYLYGPFTSPSGMAIQYGSAKGSKHFVGGQSKDVREFTRSVVIHEMGHQYMGMNLHSRLGPNRDAAVRKELEPFLHGSFFPKMKTAHVSKYARRNPHEAWAELFTAAVTGLPTQSGSKDAVDYPKAVRGILDKHYPAKIAEAARFREATDLAAIAKEAGYVCGFMHQHPELADAEYAGIGEASDDEHFYGPWKGGARKEGGHPAGEDTLGRYVDDKGQWDARRMNAVHEPYYASVMDGVPKSDTPTVYMTGGGPASGKTQGLLHNPEAGIPQGKAAAHIDPDGAKASIPEYNAGIKSGYAGAAAYAHEESSHMSKVAVARALGAQHDVVYDSVGDSGIEKLSSKVQQMRDQGAKRIAASYAVVNVNEAIRRSDARAKDTGRFVPHAYIRQAHSDVRNTLQGAIDRGTFDDLKVFDTNGAKPRLIATYTKGGGLKVADQKAWSAYTSGAYET